MQYLKNRYFISVLIALFCWVGSVSFAHAAKSKSSRSAKQKPLYPGAHGLAKEWEPENTLKMYNQNYLLVYSETQPINNAPTSPNTLNQITTPYNLDYREMKFQISVKHDLANFRRWGALWFAYTQRSFWQFYDRTNSQPFRETDYAPELIYSLRPTSFSLLNIGAVHDSNGESVPRSRSWNRAYVQPAVELSDGDGTRLVLFGRWWNRLAEDPLTDDNPDISEFMGDREFEVRFLQERSWQISAIRRKNSVQVDIAAPLSVWFFLGEPDENNLNFHIQYFNGYGESLLDYNQQHISWSAGFSFPLD